jgi:hypothetical protein
MAPIRQVTLTRNNVVALAIVLVLFALAFIYLIPGINQPVNIYDEGIIAYSAVRVMDGHVPYRDFWSIYSPAQFYVLAALFKGFGTTILVERLWDTATRALLAVAAYLIVSRLASRRLGLLAWVAVTAWVGYYSYSYQNYWVFYGYPAFPAIAFCLASILALIVYFERPRTWLLTTGGILLGIAALFRHDFAIYCFAGQLLALAYYGLLSPANPPGSLRDRIGLIIRSLLPFALGAAVLVVPMAVYFILQAPLNELVYDLFTFPAAIFPRFRALPYPSFGIGDRLAFYLPFLVFALAGAVAVVMLRQRRAEHIDAARDARHLARALGIVMLIVFGLLAFNQARVRSDLIHTPAFFLPALILIVVLLKGIPQMKLQPAGDASIAMTITAGVMLAAVLLPPVVDRIQLLSDPQRMSPPIAHGLERARTALVGQDMGDAVRYIQAHTGPADRIYVGDSIHDRVFVNEPMFYFLAERHSATRYHELHPGVATIAPVQQEIAADLERFQAPYLVLSNQFENAREPNESALSSGVKILDEYIASHYTHVQRFGPYFILRRK